MLISQRKGWHSHVAPSTYEKEKNKGIVVVMSSPEARSPVSPSGGSPINENEMWRRLREVGLDEETLQKKDKSFLVSYITKLQSEVRLTTHHYFFT